MKFTKRVLLKSLERQRAKREKIQSRIDNFDRENPKWSLSDKERTHRLDQLQADLKHHDRVMAELRRYLEPGGNHA